LNELSFGKDLTGDVVDFYVAKIIKPKGHENLHCSTSKYIDNPEEFHNLTSS